jgi:hypothetical protein
MTSISRINDRQPGIAKHDLPTPHHTMVVRPTMPLRLIHAHDRLAPATPENA